MAEQKQAIQQLLSTDAKTQLNGAIAIYALAHNDRMARESLAQDARVIPRLAQLLKQGDDSCRVHAYGSFYSLLDVGPAVERQIANALDAAALTWLDAHDDKKLLAKLTQNPNAEALLAAKRGKTHVVALIEDATKSTDATQ